MLDSKIFDKPTFLIENYCKNQPLIPQNFHKSRVKSAKPGDSN